VSCAEDHCVTCGDVAESMRVLRIDFERDLALCEDETGAHRTVEIALVATVAEGDQLLVHAGTAISRTTAAAPGRGSSMQSPRRSRGQGVPAGAEDAVVVIR
jgi:hydrogenase maturation factor